MTIAVNGAPVDVPLTLLGPGDAVGLDPAAIARVDPAPGATDAEPYLFAAIELVPADLPWLLTPVGPGADGRLLPWLALVVVPRTAASIAPGPSGGLDRLQVAASELPPPDEAWAWAHAQVLGELSGGSAADALEADPGRWRARILAARRLDPGTSWLAALVPLFAAGAAAGRGDPAPDSPLAFAWDPAATGDVTLPVYHHWAFATVADADFETLARRLQARDLPAGVGRLPVDFSQPGVGVRGTTEALWVEGALGRIGDAQPPLPAAAQPLSDDIAALAQRTAAPLVVGPPLYGGALQAGWQEEVNADPRVRAIAGLGAEVVRREQDALVASAWRQVGELRTANRTLRWMTLAREVGGGLHRRHFAGASANALVQWSAPVQSQIRLDPQAPATMAAALGGMMLFPGAVDAPARRALRATGPLAARALAAPAAGAAPTPGAAPTAGATPAATPSTVATPAAAATPVRTIARSGPFGGVVVDPGQVVVFDPNPPPVVAGTMVTLEALAHAISVPQAQLDALTSAVIQQRAQLMIASSLVTETGDPSGLPPNSHATFAAAAEATQDALLAQLALARRPRPGVTVTALDHAQLVAALDPAPRFAALATRRVVAPASADPARGPLDDVRLAPSYPQPAVDALTALAPELLLPGLEDVPANTVTLATADQRFVEAFLLGMNHELDRELRWRGFPTVPGSTYFRRFWSRPPSDVDIVDLAQWAAATELGEHGADATAGTVLVVRGDLVRRFPGIAVSAVALVNGTPDFTNEIEPDLRGALAPDVLFAGFPWPPDQAADFDYILTQPPTAPRFGLDAESPLDAASVTRRNDLAWSQLGSDARFATAAGPLAGRTLADGAASATWGRNAADMAWLTQQAPVRLVMAGSEMVPS
ncbi:MAG: hypothetical protein U0S48_23420 [Solirubrobacteraceae bacterium]